MKKTVLALAAVMALNLTLQAEEPIRMVGSSTVYPFASAVAEQFGATTKMATPIVESTGTGGGMKIFCSSNDDKSADITNASRRMKEAEFATCAQNGVTNITEALIGFDGIAIAQSKKNKPLKLTREQIFMAVAEEVPSKDGKSLVKNPNKKWSDIDASLPNREIRVYGPPKSSGTRDSFEEMTMQHFTKKGIFKDVYHAAGHKKYSKIRQDGAYIDSGENDNLIVQKLTKDTNAIGVFGYSFLEENGNKVSGATIDGFEPTPANIASGKYPISRSLFFYVKNDHKKAKPSISKYVEMFMSEKQIGDRGALKRIGLVSSSKAVREVAIKNAISGKVLTAADLKSK